MSSTLMNYYTVVGHLDKSADKWLWSRPMSQAAAEVDAEGMRKAYPSAVAERGLKVWKTTRDDLRGWQRPGWPTGVEVVS